MKNKILTIICMFQLFALAYSEPIVKLYVKERAGISRISEPVLTGVPLPENLVTDTAEFALKDEDGDVIPCDFRIAAKWWQDKKSIRWLHVDFKADIAANETKVYTLFKDPALHSVNGNNISAVDTGNFIQITTGPLRFIVRKKNFNLFDQVWIDETGLGTFDDNHRVVASHNRGFSLLSKGVRYYASNDDSSTAVIERLGPMSCVIKAEARLRNASGTASYYIITRITSYRNSRLVKVTFSFENRNPDTDNYISMYGLNLELPLSLSEKRFALGSNKGFKTGALSTNDTAWLLVDKIDHYTYGGILNDSGNTRQDKCPDFGMISLSDNTKGAALSAKWFWQMYPSSVEASGDGLLNLGLFSHRFRNGSTAYPPRHEDHYDIYAGMSRTHEIRFAFFNTKDDSTIRSELSGVNSRLFALAPAAWFCRTAKAFGAMAEKENTSLFMPSNLNLISSAEKAMQLGANVCIGNTNSLIGGKDAYDYLGWGDNPHASFGDQFLLWNGNYYDLPHLMFQNFAWTMDYRYLDYAIAHASHVQDLHQCHFEPGDYKDGACRYCPVTNQIGDGNNTLSPVVMTQTSHHKTQCLFDNYYLTGEERSLETALRGVKWIQQKMDEGTDLYNLLSFPRRLGNILLTLMEGYKFNFDPAILNQISYDLRFTRENLNGGGIDGGSGAWMGGILLDALTDIAIMLDNDSSALLVKQIVDKTTYGIGSNMAYPRAWVASRFHDSTYLSWAAELYPSLGNGMNYSHHEVDYSLAGRAVVKSFYYFAIPDSLKSIGIENIPELPDTRDPIRIYPNPFNPNIRISYNLKNHEKGDIHTIIYSLDGRRVYEKSLKSENLGNGCAMMSWDGRAASGKPAAAGIYIVKVAGNGIAFQKRITLIR